MSAALYGDIIEIGPDAQPIQPDIVLGFRSGVKQGVIQNVQEFTHAAHLTSASEISFNVHKGEGENRCELWDEIRDFKLAFIPHLGMNGFNPWYELAVTIDEGDETIKHCQGIHLQEAELSQLTLNEFEVNTESDIAREDYIPTVLYNPARREGSLLHRIIKDKASHYSIGHVDDSIANKQRTFSWDGESIVDALNDVAEELECIFVYGISNEDDGLIHRTISAYDLNDYCLDCGERGSFEHGVCKKCGSGNIRFGYGEDIGIFINYENFAENLNYTSNKDSVKNCFRLVAGDDLMTATVVNLNPNGSQYIWYLSDATRADMSSALRDRLSEYDALYDQYRDDRQMDVPQSIIDRYNSLITKYRVYDKTLEVCPYPVVGYTALIGLYYQALNLYNLLKTSLAPMSEYGRPTTAQEQITSLNVSNLSPLGVTNASTISATTVNSVLLNYAKVYIDTSLFRISIEESSYANQVWTGRLRLTSYDDEEDTAVTSTLVISITDAEPEYLRCQIEKVMKKNESDATSMVTLFEKEGDDFKAELHHYSIDNLDILASMARGCLDVLIEHGQGEPGATMYQSMYLKYYEKSGFIQAELNDREAEAEILRGSGDSPKGMLDYVESARKSIMNALDLRTYLGETLWSELSSYRRDETYQNDNFISDGLTDTELISMAQEFLSYAQTEIIKSATLQHTISCDINNFLLVRERDVLEKDSSIVTHTGIRLITNNDRYIVKTEPELSLLNYRFAVGNWLHVEIDGVVYKLRMVDYEIDYGNLQSIMVEFSDVTYSVGSEDDIKSVLSKAQSMATSYNATQKQANKGYAANEQIVNMVTNGLDLTNKRIVNSATNQTLLVDETGMLMRAKNDYSDDYNAEQVKIINHGLYYTNDNWRTVQAGLGKFIYYDPEEGEYVQDYGLIARKVVGKMIVGNDLNIYAANGSMKMDDDGFTVTTDATDVNQKLFTLQRRNSNGTYTKYVYVGNDGKFVIDGDIIASGTLAVSKITGSITNNTGWGIDFTNNTMSIGTLSADNIKAGTLDASLVTVKNLSVDFIGPHSLSTDRLTGSITNGEWGINFTNGTMSIGKLAVGRITGTLGNTSSGNWGIDFNNGTMSIGNLSANNIKTGTLSADVIATHSLSIEKLSGSVNNGGWGINFTNGTMSIGSLSANNISGGTMSANLISGGTINGNNVNIVNLNASNIIGGRINANNVEIVNLNASNITSGTLTVGGQNNGRGSIVVRDGNGNVMLTLDRYGVTSADNCTRFANYVEPSDSVQNTGLITYSKDFNYNTFYSGRNITFYKNNGVDDNGNYIKLGKKIYLDDNGALCFQYIRESIDMQTAVHSFTISNMMTIDMSKIWAYNFEGMSITANGPLTANANITASNGTITCKDLTVSGTKNRVVSTSQFSNRLLYCYETPSPLFGDVGEAIIGDDGICYIALDAVFAETVTTTQYQVFLQVYGDGQCWVRERRGSYFIVEGTPGLIFGWEIKAKQRDYDQLRLEKNDDTYTPHSKDYGEEAAKYIEDLMQGRIIM